MKQTPKFPYPLGEEVQQALWRQLQNQFLICEQTWVPLWLNDLSLGLLVDKWRNLLKQDWQGKWHEDSDGLHLYAQDWLNMGDRLQNIAQNWHNAGYFDGWRNEKFDVCDTAGKPLFALERSAFRPLGLLSNAVHINGLTRVGEQWQFWIGRRSPYKAVDPNKLDNLVGGGIASGERVEEAMMREGFEEAGLPEHLLQNLSRASLRSSFRVVSRGLHRENLHIFDVVLPDDVQPENQDGEVVEFLRFDVETLAEKMGEGLLMNDAFLATLDAFARFGLLNESSEMVKWLKGQARCADISPSAQC